MKTPKNLKRITNGEVNQIVGFYEHVIDNTPDMSIYARWKMGQHPTENGIINYIADDAMYALVENNQILGTMAVTMSQGDDYHSVNWGKALADAEVEVIHILAVNPLYQRQGIGKKMLDEVIKLAKEQGKKAVRLDALASNTPAHHMYENKGFAYRGKQNLYAENTGFTDFYYFEYLIK